jgi:phage-related protein
MPAGQIIGRVSVKVLPDTDSFRKEARAKLAVIEKGLKFVVPTTLDITGAKRDLITALRGVNAENKTMASRKIRLYTQISTDGMRGELAKYRREATAMAKTQPIKIKADLTAANVKLELDKTSLDYVKAQIEHWRRGVDPVKVTVKAEYSSTAATVASVRLAWLSRDRIVTLIPRVSKAALTQVSTLLASLSGARMLQSTWNNIWDMFKNLDKVIPMIALIGNAIGLLGISALTSASNIFAVASSLGSIAALGLVLPGVLAGVVMGLGLTLLAFKGIKKYMPGLYKEWTDFKELATKDFWSTASAGVQKLATVYLPQLATTAKTLGTFWGTLASELSKPFHVALGTMFDNLNRSIKISAANTGVFADIITQLGLTGSAYLPVLATWFGRVSTTFDNWLKQISADGTMKRWVDNGIAALHDLGRVLSGTLKVLADLGRAAQNAGGSTLGILADSLARLHTITSGPVFQQGMTDAFMAAHKAITLITTVSGPAVSKFFKTFSTTLTTLLPTIGSTIGTAVKAIADALAMPAVQQGLISMFDGIRKGVEGLAPALPALGTALGAIATIIGDLATSFGPLLAGFLTALADVFLALRPAIEPLIPILGNALLKIIQALAPAFVAVATALAPVLSTLGGALADAVVALTPYLATIADAIGRALVDALVALVPYIGPLAKSFTDMTIQLLPLIPQILDLTTKCLDLALKALPALNWGFGEAIRITGLVVTAVSWVVTAITNSIGAIIRVAATVAEGLHLPFADGLRKASDSFDATAAKAKTDLNSIPPVATTAGTAVGVNFAAGLASKAPAVDAAGYSVALGVTTPLSTLPDVATTAGLTVGESLAVALNSKVSAVNAAGYSVALGVKMPLGSIDASGLGAKVGLDFTAGLVTTEPLVLTEAGRVAWYTRQGFGSVDANPIGAALGFSFSQGIIDTSYMATNAAGSLALGVKNPLGAIDAYPYGSAVVRGFASGIAQNTVLAVMAATSLAGQAQAAMRANLQSNSPSKVTMGIGQNAAEGLAIGMNNRRSIVVGAANYVAVGVTAPLSAINSYPYGANASSRFASGVGANKGAAGTAGKSVVQGFWDGMTSVWNNTSNWIGTIAGWIKAHKGPLSLDAQLLVPAGTAIMQGLWDGLKSTYGYITTWISSVASGISSGVARWLPIVNQALAIVGQPVSLGPIVLRRMNQESGGNQFAINLTDSNAKAGHPSQGLMQCIPGTFNAYRLPALSANIFEPLSNVVASMRYALSTYGSLAGAYNRPGGYAGGTDSAAPGWHWVGEKGPELVNFRGSEIVVPNYALGGVNARHGGLSGAFGSTGGSNPMGGINVTIPMMPTSSTPEDVADALLFALRRIANGGVYAQA